MLVGAIQELLVAGHDDAELFLNTILIDEDE